MPPTTLSATLEDGQAALRFPYDDGLRRLLRTIPGRRWDPVARAWCIPVEPEQAEALSRLLAALPVTPQVEPALARLLERRRARRSRGEGRPIDAVRPDEDWWLSFATDLPDPNVDTLLAHPAVRRLPVLARALVPLDERAR